MLLFRKMKPTYDMVTLQVIWKTGESGKKEMLNVRIRRLGRFLLDFVLERDEGEGEERSPPWGPCLLGYAVREPRGPWAPGERPSAGARGAPPSGPACGSLGAEERPGLCAQGQPGAVRPLWDLRTNRLSHPDGPRRGATAAEPGDKALQVQSQSWEGLRCGGASRLAGRDALSNEKNLILNPSSSDSPTEHSLSVPPSSSSLTKMRRAQLQSQQLSSL